MIYNEEIKITWEEDACIRRDLAGFKPDIKVFYWRDAFFSNGYHMSIRFIYDICCITRVAAILYSDDGVPIGQSIARHEVVGEWEIEDGDDLYRLHIYVTSGNYNAEKGDEKQMDVAAVDELMKFLK